MLLLSWGGTTEYSDVEISSIHSCFMVKHICEKELTFSCVGLCYATQPAASLAPPCSTLPPGYHKRPSIPSLAEWP